MGVNNREIGAASGVDEIHTISKQLERLTAVIYNNQGGPISGSGTANQLAYFINPAVLGALTTTTYPSLTELSYIKGLTAPAETHFWKTTGNIDLLGNTFIDNNYILGIGTNVPLDEFQLYAGSSNFTQWSHIEATFSNVKLSHIVSGVGTAQILLSNTGLILQGGSTTGIYGEIDLGGNTSGSHKFYDFRTSTNKSGLEYGADYSANYTIRSLVDKAYTLGTKTFTGKQIFASQGVTAAQFNLPVSAAPTSPASGDVWREDDTNTGLKIRINGVTKTITVA